MANPTIIATAPNGAYKTRADHSALPILPVELAKTAKACQEAGAVMIHLHVRDRQQQHSLNPDHYQIAIDQIRAEVGDEMIVQITTESAGKYEPQEQIECVKRVKPEAASIAIREFIPDKTDDLAAARFFEWLFQNRVAPQFILYSQQDIEHFNQLLQRGLIHSDLPNVLLVLGKNVEQSDSDSCSLTNFIDALNPACHWMLCAFGRSETSYMEQAIRLGGHCRVGFENSLFANNGDLAIDNENQVKHLAGRIETSDRCLATISDALQIMEIHR